MSSSITAGTPLKVGAIVASSQLWEVPSQVTFRLFDSATAVNPVTSQAFDAGLWFSGGQFLAGKTVRVSASFTNTDDLDMSKPLWLETVIDGTLIGSRQELVAEAPPVVDISVENFIEARSGGFIFPDNTVQTTAGITTETDPNLAAHAANASAHHAPYTDAGAVAAIKAADGPGSGLDADLLDGQHASAFASAAHNHNADYVNVTGDTMTGKLIVNPASGTAADFHGYVEVRNSAGNSTVSINPVFGRIAFNDVDGHTRVYVAGNAGNGGRINLSNASNIVTARLKGDDSDGASFITLTDSAGTATIKIDAQEASGDGAEITMYNTGGTRTIQIDSDSGTQGGYIQLYDSAGNATITLDGETGGDGRITTQELAITGGSDFSEQFDINSPVTPVEAGMLVSIDPQNPGKLIPSNEPYDRKVAGIVSGAGGVKPGMMMGQSGTIADGEYPVALTGRVYALVDTREGGEIRPGDLLTTSSVPGHAMKATNAEKRSGAIIGKAMTSLKEGKGLVLVLVSLQ
ncbi:hypothetical protein [Thiolapillus sp.]